ncbi:TetR/AcrR family transcriptional regulator [Wenjunlia tyrosinilytica]|jgi:AcrR family transcriptional regulator|uniref:TetR family transcriptional regulator n=1 Tax=Wenjunlia tyrosinilytica TaxID=1544741 RepID=A0A917ZMP5_9ACTN|nr:TetR/AcrR family transcriptional regulator [Wenjunlia tyrosinilytica]GGO86307.1 TetR family transcriptional regulator [Wenjunlia tyrosinilytica]
MGHREDLLAGAKRCLLEKGWARTTARDIVAASGTNLASIGYHYGSKDALMKAALVESLGDWGEEIERAMAADLDPEVTPLERFETIWNRMVEHFTTHRQLWAANIELVAQAEHDPQMRKTLADLQPEGREGMLEMFQGVHREPAGDSARILGAFYQALLIGVMSQWLIDPGTAPSGKDVAEALRIVASSVTATDRSRENG